MILTSRRSNDTVDRSSAPPANVIVGRGRRYTKIYSNPQMRWAILGIRETRARASGRAAKGGAPERARASRRGIARRVASRNRASCRVAFDRGITKSQKREIAFGRGIAESRRSRNRVAASRRGRIRANRALGRRGDRARSADKGVVGERARARVAPYGPSPLSSSRHATGMFSNECAASAAAAAAAASAAAAAPSASARGAILGVVRDRPPTKFTRSPAGP